MKYNSIREFFYKLNNRLFALTLVPLLVFVILYWQIQEGTLQGPFYFEETLNKVLMIVLGVVVFLDWMISFFTFGKRLKFIKRIQSLGVRLERYYSLTIFRFVIILSGSLASAICFTLTENQNFTIIGIANMILLLLLWPRVSKVCNDLQLKGDERTLVFYKKDRLH
jgi:hypothetical protein